MKIVVYGISTCDECMLLKNNLQTMKLPFDFLDADSEKHSQFLDEKFVDMLPFVIIYDDNSKNIWEKSGKITLTEIVNEIERTTRDSRRA